MCNLKNFSQDEVHDHSDIPLYMIARIKYKKGVNVIAVSGTLCDKGSSVERENRQSRMSCPMEAQSLSAISKF